MALARWSLWLILALLAAVQISIGTSRELEVPEFVLQAMASPFADAGLHAEFGEILLDPGGHLLLLGVRLSIEGVDTPILRADSISVKVDPLALWLRQVEPREIRITGADLLIPPLLSATGKAELLIDGLDATLQTGPTPRHIEVTHLTARLGPVPVDIHGTLILPAADEAETLSLDRLPDLASRHYLRFCQEAARHLPRLPPVSSPRLSIKLTPHPQQVATIGVSLSAARLELDELPGTTQSLHLIEPMLTTRFTWGGPAQLNKIRLEATEISLLGTSGILQPRVLLESMIQPAVGRFEPRLLDLFAPAVGLPGVELHNVSARTGVATLPQIQSRGVASITGGAWAFHADLDVTTGAGRLRVDGDVGAPTLELAAQRLGVDVPSILSWDESPRLAAELDLGAKGRLRHATAHFTTGPVVARQVPLDATAGQITWKEPHLRVDDILLRRRDSVARGRYEMDTRNLDFRFLLEGRLEPSEINGWFRRGWTRFFEAFEFPHQPPEASVEVSGRWKAPLRTRVFVSADAANLMAQGIPLERLRTRVFVRPGWADVLEFTAARDIGTVRGGFARQWHPPDSRRWTRVEVHAGGISDLAPTPKLLPGGGEALLALFDFSAPLEMRLDGEVTRLDLGAPASENFVLSGHTEAPWQLQGFPFDGVDFRAIIQDGVLLIEDFSAGLAEGELGGRLEIRPATNRRKTLSFDLNLAEAALGQAIRTTETWFARQRGELPKPESEFQQQLAEGKLTVALTAEGPMDDFLALQGTGSAAVAHANLANINLLGVLSAMLQRTILNFSTLQLEYANANFALNGPVMEFPSLKISGPRGAVDAYGQYHLDSQTLDFNTKVRPFEGGQGLLDTVFRPLSSVLEVKLSGKLDNPKWTFVYGPINILRNLAGEGARSESPIEPTRDPAPDPPEGTAFPPAEPDSPPASGI